LPTDKAGWIVIRGAYEDTDETLDAMASRFGVARSSISQHVRDEGWVRRRNAATIDALVLIQRMYRLIERVLVRMERASEPMSEKDAGILTRMAATVDRLIEIQARAPVRPRRGPVAKETVEMQQIRKTIARRLEQLGDF
jgi:hypothetical protein